MFVLMSSSGTNTQNCGQDDGVRSLAPMRPGGFSRTNCRNSNTSRRIWSNLRLAGLPIPVQALTCMSC